MHYSVETFKLSDWDEIDPREELKPALESLKTDIVYADVFTKGMPFFTLRADGEIVVIYGMMYGGDGTFLPSVLPSKNMHKHLKKVIKLFYEYFATYVPRKARRLEAYCDIMDTKALTLAKHFGFDVIGIRHYASAEGHDQAILERLVLCDSRKVRR